MLLQESSDWSSWVKSCLFVVFIIILIVGSTMLLLKARKTEFEATRKILRGYAMFGLCFACTRIFFMISSYDQFINGNPTGGTYLSSVWGVSAYAVTMVSIVFVFWVVEHYILNHKPVFMVIALISVGIDVLALIMILAGLSFPSMAPKDLALQVQNYVAPVLGIVILVLYIMVIKNSAGDIKRKATITFIGVLLILMSILFDATFMNNLLLALGPIRMILTPIFGIAGVLLVFYSIK
jgi:hypothetical protein